MNHYEPDAQRPEVVNPSMRIKPLVLFVNVKYSDSCLRVPSLTEKQVNVSYGETGTRLLRRNHLIYTPDNKPVRLVNH